MFSRRHPYLFFVLILTGMIAGSSVIVSLLTMAGSIYSNAIFTEKVGVIEIKGVIADARAAVEQIKNFRENNDIKAIVVRIDSPGGGVGPSQEIFRELQKTVK
ncbi:MAG: signal peptide peptidase SppA, partial [Desulfobacteraceae bacterium]|nr:signal peptide peptidase SppA [Desulfobacteraceae bacterium]